MSDEVVKTVDNLISSAFSDTPPAASTDMAETAGQAAAYLKTMAHAGRLMILCHLCESERSVGELESLLDMRQAAVSQLLARLREDGLVATRREGKTIYYRLDCDDTSALIGLLYQKFCAPD